MSVEYVPETHAVHVDAPVAVPVKLPAAQSVQLVDLLAENVPAEQGAHSVAADIAPVDEPAPQSVHAAAPAAEKVPLIHAEQLPIEDAPRLALK